MRKIYFFLLLCVLGTAPVFGQAGNALSYDGVDDYTKLPDDFTAGITGSYTVEAWVYWRGGPAWQRIFDFGRGTNEWMFLTPQSNIFGEDGVMFAISNNGLSSYTYLQAADPLPTNTWTHVAVVVDAATNTGRLYVNGVQVATGTIALSPADLGTPTIPTDLNYIGRSQFASDPYFNGIIDELRISDVVRYTANFTPSPSEFPLDANTVALWHFNEGSGQTTADASPVPFPPAFLGGTAAAETSDPAWITNSILPVTYTDFVARKAGRQVELRWEASTTDDNTYFIVERSISGGAFREIGRVDAPLAGSHQYAFTDLTPSENRNFYRLKYMEQGFAPSYSRIVSVSFVSPGSMLVYPNPLKGQELTVELQQPFTGTVEIRWNNTAGALMQRQVQQLQGMQTFTVPTRALSKGTYVLQVISGGQTATQVIIVQ